MSKPALVCILAAATLLATVGHAGEALRDPTRPYSWRAHKAARPADTGLDVTAIFISERRRVAVVNGRAVAKGDTIAGAQVLEILPYALKLRRDGRTVTARLTTASVRSGGPT